MVSIAMTTYNGEKYLREQIDSILSQTIQEFELIICDDCSNDSTVEILKEYVSKDSRIKVFFNEFNLGFLKNFEKAIDLCSGDYIALSDQDDIWIPEHLEILQKAIIDRKCSLVGANALLVDSNNNDIGCKLINDGNFPNAKGEYEFLLLHRNIFQGCSLMFKKTILKRALPFPKDIKFHDWYLALVASEEKGVCYIDMPITRYRQHSNNVTGNHRKNTFSEKMRKFFVNDLEDDGAMLEVLLKNFLFVSNDRKKVEKALVYASGCKNRKFNAISYFIKNHNRIWGNESCGMFCIRVLNMLWNIFCKGRKNEWNKYR